MMDFDMGPVRTCHSCGEAQACRDLHYHSFSGVERFERLFIACEIALVAITRAITLLPAGVALTWNTR